MGNKNGASCGKPGRTAPSSLPVDACASRAPPRADVDASTGEDTNRDDKEIESTEVPLMAVKAVRDSSSSHSPQSPFLRQLGGVRRISWPHGAHPRACSFDERGRPPHDSPTARSPTSLVVLILPPASCVVLRFLWRSLTPLTSPRSSRAWPPLVVTSSSSPSSPTLLLCSSSSKSGSSLRNRRPQRPHPRHAEQAASTVSDQGGDSVRKCHAATRRTAGHQLAGLRQASNPKSPALQDSRS